jgi:hypothetical protein
VLPTLSLVLISLYIRLYFIVSISYAGLPLNVKNYFRGSSTEKGSLNYITAFLCFVEFFWLRLHDNTRTTVNKMSSKHMKKSAKTTSTSKRFIISHNYL